MPLFPFKDKQLRVFYNRMLGYCENYIFAIMCSLLNAQLVIGRDSYIASCLGKPSVIFTVLVHIIKILLQNKDYLELDIVCFLTTNDEIKHF